ncbi:hypothetical protein M885DRAFT_504961 [Pelagophyceae sp. CCMP2097]|nr:hypothetical protein M885DRAFT_504961 [Pelagophyceae sp. CCMP2097]
MSLEVNLMEDLDDDAGLGREEVSLRSISRESRRGAREARLRDRRGAAVDEGPAFGVEFRVEWDDDEWRQLANTLNHATLDVAAARAQREAAREAARDGARRAAADGDSAAGADGSAGAAAAADALLKDAERRLKRIRKRIVSKNDKVVQEDDTATQDELAQGAQAFTFRGEHVGASNASRSGAVARGRVRDDDAVVHGIAELLRAEAPARRLERLERALTDAECGRDAPLALAAFCRVVDDEAVAAEPQYDDVDGRLIVLTVAELREAHIHAIPAIVQFLDRMARRDHNRRLALRAGAVDAAQTRIKAARLVDDAESEASRRRFPDDSALTALRSLLATMLWRPAQRREMPSRSAVCR